MPSSLRHVYVYRELCYHYSVDKHCHAINHVGFLRVVKGGVGRHELGFIADFSSDRGSE